VTWRPLGEVMAVALVHDGPETMRYISPELLASWGISFDTALTHALENLRRRSSEPLEMLAPGTCGSTWRDNYDTSRMLLDEVVRRCPVRGEPVVLLPHRDLLLITGSRDEEGLVLAAERALALLGLGHLGPRREPLQGLEDLEDRPLLLGLPLAKALHPCLAGVAGCCVSNTINKLANIWPLPGTDRDQEATTRTRSLFRSWRKSHQRAGNPRSFRPAWAVRSFGARLSPLCWSSQTQCRA
jgi:hypothetical protein